MNKAANQNLPSLSEVQARYEGFKAENLQLNMTRGKPSPEQLDLANGLIDGLEANDFKAKDGTDCRNYGGLDGLPEAKQLFADYMEVDTHEIMIGGNSSLSLMHGQVSQALLHGVPGGDKPWRGDETVKFLCPCPGYDRHFNICNDFGIEMIPVNLTTDGPDMDQVEALVRQDASIKAIWCVPKYSNPTGTTYSSETVERLAAIQTAATDFRILWDNAYAVHTLTEAPAPLANLLRACQKAGNPNRALMFGSTSKISFAGAGVSMLAASEENLAAFKKHLGMQTIGPDKLNQLRHVRFFENYDGILKHMQKHAELLKPKFDTVDRVLTNILGDSNLASWTKPLGGYFISLDTSPGHAKNVVNLAKEVGVQLTAAGATFPGRKDPQDQNIRIAPSLPSLNEIERATEVVAVCIQLSVLSKAS